MRHDFAWTIERGEDDAFDVEIEGSYYFGSPPSLNDPGDPDEFEILSVTLDGKPFELTEQEDEAVCLWALENPPEDDYLDYD